MLQPKLSEYHSTLHSKQSKMNNQQNLRIKISLYLNYFVFAILLNCVGIVILKSKEVYGVTNSMAGTLELFKDLPIAIVSFLVASFLPRIGYRKAMLIGLGIVTFACIGMYFGNSFWTAKLFFMAVGSAFALIKVSVYSTIGLITETEGEHNNLMSSIEGLFMFGIALGFFLFPAFNTEGSPDAWLNVFWLLAAISALSFLFLYSSDFKEDVEIAGANLSEDFAEMLRLMARMLVIVFVISAFLFVMVEQGIMTWMPTFNKEVLLLDENIAIRMTSILVISAGIGRIMAGRLAQKFSWFWVLLVCIILAMAMVIFVLPKATEVSVGKISAFADIPPIAFAFPIVGLFLAPIYPLINSTVLSALPKKLHSHMSGLIIIFSAIGGTSGSYLMGVLFDSVGPKSGFYYTLIPIVGLLLALFLLNKLTKRKNS